MPSIEKFLLIFRINMSRAGFEPGVTIFDDCEATALFSMSTKDLSCLLVGKTSQGRDFVFEREEALIHPITNK